MPGTVDNLGCLRSKKSDVMYLHRNSDNKAAVIWQVCVCVCVCVCVSVCVCVCVCVRVSL